MTDISGDIGRGDSAAFSHENSAYIESGSADVFNPVVEQVLQNAAEIRSKAEMTKTADMTASQIYKDAECSTFLSHSVEDFVTRQLSLTTQLFGQHVMFSRFKSQLHERK